ncbi:hypothetical protein DH2020_003693 [Rehmannia glutinosa]|uniref:Uncharacterized protein n=1 Tax=Rehmannia glutinosa TaxID=99300 RepID=A0ABR0XMC4_REHGL
MRSFELYIDSDSQSSSSSSSGDVTGPYRPGHDVSRPDPIRSIPVPAGLICRTSDAPGSDPSGVFDMSMRDRGRSSVYRKKGKARCAPSLRFQYPPSPWFTPNDPSSATPTVPLGGSQDGEPIAVAQAPTHDLHPLVTESPQPLLAIEAGEAIDPKGKGKSKSKSKSKKNKDRSRLAKSKGSGGSKQKKKVRVEKEKPTDEEISVALAAIASRQKKLLEAREQVRVETSRPQPEFSGTRLIPSWNISPESSILKTRVGEDSLELYQGCSRPWIEFSFARCCKCGAQLDTSESPLAGALPMPSPCTRRLEREKITIEAKIKSEYAARVDFDPSRLDPELDGNGEKVSLEGDEEEDLEVMSSVFASRSEPQREDEEVLSQEEIAGQAEEDDDKLDVSSSWGLPREPPHLPIFRPPFWHVFCSFWRWGSFVRSVDRV